MFHVFIYSFLFIFLVRSDKGTHSASVVSAASPSYAPVTKAPSRVPTLAPTYKPSSIPSDKPTLLPSTLVPSKFPTVKPTARPSQQSMYINAISSLEQYAVSAAYVKLEGGVTSLSGNIQGVPIIAAGASMANGGSANIQVDDSSLSWGQTMASKAQSYVFTTPRTATMAYKDLRAPAVTTLTPGLFYI